MVRFRCYTSTYFGELRPWRIVGPLGRPSNGLLWTSRTARARPADVLGTWATTALIISGRCRGQRRSSTAWCAVQTPHARVEGARSAPKPHGPSVCRAGVWAGRCCAGSAIAALPAIGRSPSFVPHDRTRTRSGCLTMPSSPLLAGTKRCWRQASQTRPGSLRATRISRRGCERSTDGSRQRAMQPYTWYASSWGSG
jgi:hypothetical protein